MRWGMRNAWFFWLRQTYCLENALRMSINHNGVYLNYGIGAMYGLLLWMPALIVAGVAATLRSKMR